MLPKKVKLEDGRSVVVRALDSRDKAAALQKYINALIREKVYFILDKPFTLREEEKWLKQKLAAIKKGDQAYLVAEVNGEIVAGASADRQPGYKKDVVLLGIGVAREWRGIGLGEKLFEALLREARKKLKPRIIYLTSYGSNERALRLYKKLGFREVARLRKWIKFRGKLEDEVVMRLKT